MPVNHRLRQARIDLGLTGGETASAVGYTREHLSKFEHGHQYRGRDYAPDFIFKLARYLDVYLSPDEIFNAEIAPLPSKKKTPAAKRGSKGGARASVKPHCT